MKHLGDVIVGAAASKNNTDTTGTPFIIPPGTQIVYYRTTATDVTVRSDYTAGTLSVPSTLAATSADFPLVGGSTPVAFAESVAPIRGGGETWTTAFYSAGGATVSVFGTAS